MILEARQALYLQRLRYGAERITPELALGWATRGSARLLGRSDIGELAPASRPTWPCSSSTARSRGATTRSRRCCCALPTVPTG